MISPRGAPFVAVESGAPLATIAANGAGFPIRLVDSGAPPIVIQGGALGPEIILDPDFSNGTDDWTTAGGASIIVGEATLPPGSSVFADSNPIVIGRTYRLIVNISDAQPGTYVNLFLGGQSWYGITSAGEFQMDFTVTSTSSLQISNDPGASGSAKVSSASVRQVI